MTITLTKIKVERLEEGDRFKAAPHANPTFRVKEQFNTGKRETKAQKEGDNHALVFVEHGKWVYKIEEDAHKDKV